MTTVYMIISIVLATSLGPLGKGGQAASLIKAFSYQDYSFSRKASISGQVIDLNNEEKLAGAKVKVVGHEYTSYTDFDGNFRFDKLPPGTYKLRLTYPSYSESTTTAIEINAGQECSLTLALGKSTL